MPAKIRLKDGIPRVMVVAPDFEDYVKTSFDQIRISGTGNQAIFNWLLSAVMFVTERATDENRRRARRQQVDLIAEFA